MSNCIIEGKRCTMCCQAIILQMPYRVLLGTNIGGDKHNIMKTYWKPISKYRAKKINPYLFERFTEEQIKEMHFYKCTALTEEGCGVYDNRPMTCSEYPWYQGNSRDKINTELPEYHPECTEWKIPLTDITEE